MEETAIVRSRKSQSGSSGSFARCSASKNAASIIADAISNPTTRSEAHP